jgi:hypothetical protein
MPMAGIGVSGSTARFAGVLVERQTLSSLPWGLEGRCRLVRRSNLDPLCHKMFVQKVTEQPKLHFVSLAV